MQKNKNTGLIAPIFLSLIFSVFIITSKYSFISERNKLINLSKPPSPATDIILSPTPTEKPFAFAQMNALWGPCTKTAVLSYHHVQSKENALKNIQVPLTTFTDIFEVQLKYYKENGYQTIEVGSLINFFNKTEVLPDKSIILSFDDGYGDIYSDAFPLLKKYNFNAVVFLSTGLVDNKGYLTWDEISEMSRSGLIYFGNHTWSHSPPVHNEEKIVTEIRTADTQLSEKGLNAFKIFAYPYGTTIPFTQKYLASIDYELAFTTQYGKVLCAKNNLVLPRVRAGNLIPDKNGFY